jgi:hypothetical protein
MCSDGRAERFLRPGGFHAWRWRFVILWIVVFSVVIGWSVRTIGHDQDRTCRVAERDNTQLRKLLQLAQHNAAVTLRRDPLRLARSRVFYRQALALLPPVDCDHL